MKYYYVTVEDRQTHANVVVGAMLTLSECRELMSVLNRYNSCDLLILRFEEELF